MAVKSSLSKGSNVRPDSDNSSGNEPPLDAITEQYPMAIKEENYEENFKRHEDMISGASDDELDMEQLFADAEKLLEDEDADSTDNT